MDESSEQHLPIILGLRSTTPGGSTGIILCFQKCTVWACKTGSTAMGHNKRLFNKQGLGSSKLNKQTKTILDPWTPQWVHPLPYLSLPHPRCRLWPSHPDNQKAFVPASSILLDNRQLSTHPPVLHLQGSFGSLLSGKAPIPRPFGGVSELSPSLPSLFSVLRRCCPRSALAPLCCAPPDKTITHSCCVWGDEENSCPPQPEHSPSTPGWSHCFS